MRDLDWINRRSNFVNYVNGYSYRYTALRESFTLGNHRDQEFDCASVLDTRTESHYALSRELHGPYRFPACCIPTSTPESICMKGREASYTKRTLTNSFFDRYKGSVRSDTPWNHLSPFLYPRPVRWRMSYSIPLYSLSFSPLFVPLA